MSDTMTARNKDLFNSFDFYLRTQNRRSDSYKDFVTAAGREPNIIYPAGKHGFYNFDIDKVLVGAGNVHFGFMELKQFDKLERPFEWNDNIQRPLRSLPYRDRIGIAYIAAGEATDGTHEQHTATDIEESFLGCTGWVQMMSGQFTATNDRCAGNYCTPQTCIESFTEYKRYRDEVDWVSKARQKSSTAVIFQRSTQVVVDVHLDKAH